MKLSDFTLEIFQNFIHINNGLVIKKDKTVEGGTRIRTISTGETMGEEAISASIVIPENFSNDIFIGNLREFTSIVKAIEQPSFDFTKDHVTIFGTNVATSLTYARESEIVHDYDDNNYPKIRGDNVTFTLSNENLNKILKFADILQLPHLKVHQEGGKILVSVVDRNIPDAKTAHVMVGNAENVGSTESVLPQYFSRSVFKLLPLDYEVTLTNGFAIFANKENKVEYAIVALRD